MRGLWAPLVFSRTLHVDFRLLALPVGVPREDLEWMQAHINGTTVFADDLRDVPRWALFKNERYCVFGVTTMASSLADDNTVVAGRDLYLFAGFVTRCESMSGGVVHPAIPALLQLDLEPYKLFRPLYEHVNNLWEDHRFTLTPKEIEHPFIDVPLMTQVFAEHGPATEVSEWTDLEVNGQADRMRLYPYAAMYAVWDDSAAFGQPISFCSGLPDRRTAAETPFLNASVRNIESIETKHRAAAEPAEEARPKIAKGLHPGWRDRLK